MNDTHLMSLMFNYSFLTSLFVKIKYFSRGEELLANINTRMRHVFANCTLSATVFTQDNVTMAPTA